MKIFRQSIIHGVYPGIRQKAFPLFLITAVFSLQYGCSQHTAPLSNSNLFFEPIPYSEPDINAPGRGAEQWHDQNQVNIPAKDSNSTRMDVYYRFNWSQLETGKGQYDWTVFDTLLHEAINNRQKFSFGIMATCPGCRDNGTIIIEEKSASYPAYLHQLMQSENVKDWVSPLSETWVPNWNSEHYLAALEALNKAINDHLGTGIYNGIRYKDVIGYIDIRGYGSFGEWHEAGIIEQMADHPAGTQATVATLKRIIDAHTRQFPDYPLVALLAVFDANMLNNTKNPPEVGYHALTTHNKWGALGWRRDNWGAMDNYLSLYLEKNPASYNNLSFKEALLDRWKTAPIVGEPIQDGAVDNGCEYGDLENQVRRYHASSFGNGNYAIHQPPCMHDNIRAASKAAGYRLILEGGYIDSTVKAGDSLRISLAWKNSGIAPVYEKWQVVFEFRDILNDSLQWSGISHFSPAFFLPEKEATLITDALALPDSFPAGNYNIKLLIKDPGGYRSPLPLAIKGRHSDGSYTLRTVEVVRGK